MKAYPPKARKGALTTIPFNGKISYQEEGTGWLLITLRGRGSFTGTGSICAGSPPSDPSSSLRCDDFIF